MRRGFRFIVLLAIVASAATPHLQSAGAAQVRLRSSLARPSAAVLVRQAMLAFRTLGTVHATTDVTETTGHTFLSVRGSEDMSLRDHRSNFFESQTTGRSPHTSPPLRQDILAEGARTALNVGSAPWLCTVGVPYPLAVDPTYGYRAVDPALAGRDIVRGQVEWLVNAGVEGPDGVRGMGQYEISQEHRTLLELKVTVIGKSVLGPRPALHETISYSRYGEHFSTHMPAGCIYHRLNPAGVEAFRVAGFGMYPTLKDSQWVWVDRNAYRVHPVRRGDIVVFNATPAGPSYRGEDFVKRIIGLPGDSVAVRHQQVYINDHPLIEPYISPFNRPTYTLALLRLPPNDYFVLGDNRNDSQDSHIWGFLPKRYIIGKVLMNLDSRK